MAIETLDHSSSGLPQLMAMQAQVAKKSKENKKVRTGAIGILLLMCAHWFSAY
jgi:hypothetical protein